MNKNISILLADCYPYWIIALASSVPVLFGLAFTGVLFDWVLVVGATLITLFLIGFTAVRATQLRGSKLETLNRRYKENLRDFEYNLGKEFKRLLEENCSVNSALLKDFKREINEENEASRKILHNEIGAMVGTAEERLKSLYEVNKKQIKETVFKKDLTNHGDRLLKKFQKSIDKSLSVYNASLHKIESQNNDMSKLWEKKLVSTRKDLESTYKRRLQKYDEQLKSFLAGTQEKFEGTLSKKDLEVSESIFHAEIQTAIDNATAEQNTKLNELQKKINEDMVLKEEKRLKSGVSAKKRKQRLKKAGKKQSPKKLELRVKRRNFPKKEKIQL